MLFKRYKIGFRAVKTTVAVAICILLAALFGRQDKFYASIAAIICMRKTSTETSSAGIQRIVGTVVGGAVGLVVLLITRFSPCEEVINLFLCPVCVLFVIYLCNVVGRKSSVEIGTRTRLIPWSAIPSTTFFILALHNPWNTFSEQLKPNQFAPVR